MAEKPSAEALMEVADQLDGLTIKALRAWDAANRAFKRISRDPLPGEQWQTALRPARLALCVFLRDFRETRRLHARVVGYDPEHLRVICKDTLFVLSRLRSVGQAAAASPGEDDLRDLLHILDNLVGFIWDLGRETKPAWRVFNQLHMESADTPGPLGEPPAVPR